MFREYKWYLAHGFKRKVALEIVNARQPYYKTVGKEWRQICNYQKSELKIIDLFFADKAIFVEGASERLV